MRRTRPLLLCAVLLATALPGSFTAAADQPADPPAGQEQQPRPLDQVIPAPASVRAGGAPFSIGEQTVIRVPGASDEVRRVGGQLAALLRPSTGYRLPVTARPGDDGIQLKLLRDGAGADARKSALGVEGYRLKVSPRAVVISAPTGTGLFHGIQTLRQLLPAQVESRTEQPGPWRVAGGTITDTPRYAYRGAMLDVSRHFFGVDEVKRYIDQLAL
ncbi:MAG: glycoside hydrolase family 20 zincin-like fold domain-containing protein, partial [Streptomyces sp.]